MNGQFAGPNPVRYLRKCSKVGMRWRHESCPYSETPRSFSFRSELSLPATLAAFHKRSIAHDCEVERCKANVPPLKLGTTTRRLISPSPFDAVLLRFGARHGQPTERSCRADI